MKKGVFVLAAISLLLPALGRAQVPGKVPNKFGQTYSDRAYIRFGDSEDAILGYDTTQTNDALVFGLSTDSETVLFMQKGDVGTDVGLSDLNIPNIAVVGADPGDWVRIYHDGTNPVIRSSSGTLKVTNGIETTITGNADTATALAANPTDCAANTFATTIAANGNLTCAAVGDAGVTDALTISGGTINSSIIGGTTPAAATVTTLTATGAVTFSSTTNIGWSIVSGANTACNTTCTNACVHGWDTASGEVAVDCADATADKCLCAGSN